MKKIIFSLIIILSISIMAFREKDKTDKKFTLSSKDVSDTFNQDHFGAGQNGCTGGNKSPQLSWKNAPEKTKSFAVTMVDINAFGPGIPFDHWMLIDIPSSATSLIKDAGNISGANLPSGAKLMPNGAYPKYVSKADFARAYAGVCPNPGKTNDYEITIYALNVARLNVSDSANSSELKMAIQAATIASAKMSVTASR
jgi:Raf kinase inhibitor-like YbhB/YbcL family protein